MRSIVQYNRKDAIVNNLGTFFLWILLGLMTIVPQRIPIIADTTPIQRQISCNIQNDKKMCVNAKIYDI